MTVWHAPSTTTPYSDERLRAFSLRQLKAVLRVAELRNVTQAAHSLSRSQTAITKSINEIETNLGYRLFERSSTGLTPTAYGTAFAKRLKSIKNILEQANEFYQRHHSRPKPLQHIPMFTMDLSARRMASLIALARSGDVKRAAKEVQLTPSAIYKFLRELEAQLDLSIFEKRPNGILRPTEFGASLLSNLNLVFAELRHALEDLRNIDGQLLGHVNVGTMPSTRAVLVPAALELLLEAHPQVKVTTREAPFDEMALALKSGDLDMIATGTRPLSGRAGLTSIDLFEDKLCLVARSDHALLENKTLNAQHLNEARWVIPPASTPAGRLYTEIMREIGLDKEIVCVESNSIMILRSLLLNSDFISISSMQQTEIERNAGTISILPFELPDRAWPVGAIVRDNTEPSPAASAFLEHLKGVSASFH